MRFINRLYHKIVGKVTGKYYLSIYDLPIARFQRILESNDYSELCYKGSLPSGFLMKQWHKIYKQFIDKFGIPESYRKYLKAMKKRSNELERIWVKGQKYRQSFADIYKKEAEQYINETNEDFYESLAYVSKLMNRRIDPEKETVAEFYGIIKTLSKING